MRKFLAMPVIAIIIQCSPSCGTKDGTAMKETMDSVTIQNDSLQLADEPSAEPAADERDTSDLELVYNETKENTLSTVDGYYRVSISNKQYEAVSDVTWYFDADFSPRYFSLDWAAEGNEGYTELVIEDGGVVCGTIQEYNTTKKWCNETGGTSTAWEEEADGSVVEILPITYGSTLDDELNEFLEVLTRILNENEAIENDDDLYTIKKEVEVNYGSDFTETLEVTIPRKLYDQLKGI